MVKRGILFFALLLALPMVFAQNLFGDLGAQFEANQDMFILMAVFVIMFLVIFTALVQLKVLGKNRGYSVLIALSISAIATFYLWKNETLADLLASYTGLGTLIIFLVPFLIWAAIVNFVASSQVRIGLWVAYLAFFVYTWYSRATFGNTNVFWMVIASTVAMMVFNQQIYEAFLKFRQK